MFKKNQKVFIKWGNITKLQKSFISEVDSHFYYVSTDKIKFSKKDNTEIGGIKELRPYNSHFRFIAKNF